MGLNAQIDTLKNVVIVVTARPFEANCNDYCKSAMASLFNNGAKVLDISLESDLQRNIYTLLVRSNIAQIQLHLNQSADSKLNINYKDLVLIEAQANRRELVKLAVQTRDYGSFS